MLPLILAFACGDGTPAAQVGACPECPVCPESADQQCVQMSPWAGEILAPVVARLEAGVQPHDGAGIALCHGRTRCESVMDVFPEPLEPGEYVVRANLDVPEYGEGWRVDFQVDCTLTTAAGRKKMRNHDQSYELVHRGGGRGTTIDPLWRVKSPSKGGQTSCDLRLTPVRPDGSAQDALQLKYSVPADYELPASEK